MDELDRLVDLWRDRMERHQDRAEKNAASGEYATAAWNQARADVLADVLDDARRGG